MPTIFWSSKFLASKCLLAFAGHLVDQADYQRCEAHAREIVAEHVYGASFVSSESSSEDRVIVSGDTYMRNKYKPM